MPAFTFETVPVVVAKPPLAGHDKPTIAKSQHRAPAGLTPDATKLYTAKAVHLKVTASKPFILNIDGTKGPTWSSKLPALLGHTAKLLKSIFPDHEARDDGDKMFKIFTGVDVNHGTVKVKNAIGAVTHLAWALNQRTGDDCAKIPGLTANEYLFATGAKTPFGYTAPSWAREKAFACAIKTAGSEPAEITDPADADKASSSDNADKTFSNDDADRTPSIDDTLTTTKGKGKGKAKDQNSTDNTADDSWVSIGSTKEIDNLNRRERAAQDAIDQANALKQKRKAVADLESKAKRLKGDHMDDVVDDTATEINQHLADQKTLERVEAQILATKLSRKIKELEDLTGERATGDYQLDAASNTIGKFDVQKLLSQTSPGQQRGYKASDSFANTAPGKLVAAIKRGDDIDIHLANTWLMSNTTEDYMDGGVRKTKRRPITTVAGLLRVVGAIIKGIRTVNPNLGEHLGKTWQPSISDAVEMFGDDLTASLTYTQNSIDHIVRSARDGNPFDCTLDCALAMSVQTRLLSTGHRFGNRPSAPGQGTGAGKPPPSRPQGPVTWTKEVTDEIKNTACIRASKQRECVWSNCPFAHPNGKFGKDGKKQ